MPQLTDNIKITALNRIYFLKIATERKIIAYNCHTFKTKMFNTSKKNEETIYNNNIYNC